MRSGRIAIIAWAMLMIAGIWFLLTQVSVRSGLADLLPEGATAAQRLLVSQVKTGLAGRVILLALQGAEADELASLSKELAVALRASGSFDLVGNGAQALSQDEQALLFRSRYLLSPALTKQTFSPEGLRAALEQRLEDLRSPLGSVIKPTVPSDPTGEFLQILRAWNGWKAPAIHRGVWMSADRSRALLVAQTKAPGFDADAQEAAQQEIRAAFQRLAGDRAGVIQLVMSGPGVFAVEIQRTIEQEVWWLSTVAGTLVLLLLYTSYRSVLLVALSLIPLSSGILAGMAAVQGWFGFIHGITLGFGITLLGVVDDYPIHLFSHMTLRDSAADVMRGIWPTMRLGVLTTAMGFSSLLLAGFPALTQLGLFAVAGLLTAALVTRWVLPAAVPSGFAPRPAPMPLVRKAEHLRKARLLVPAAVILAALWLMWSDTAIWETDLATLSPVPEEKKQLDQRLRAEVGAADVRDLLVVEGTMEEEVLQRSEAIMPKLDVLQAEASLTGYDIVSRYLPSRRTQLARQQLLPLAGDLDRDLRKAATKLPFAPGLFAPFLTSVEAARTQPLLERGSFQGTALGAKIGSLLFEQDTGWTSVVSLRGIADRARLANAVRQWGDPAVAYVDLKDESNRLMIAYRDRTLIILVFGLLAIAGALAVGLRSTARLWRVLVPMLGAMVVLTAVLNLSGESLTVFHLATFLLVVGLSLDYALFFTRPEGSKEERGRTIFGLLVCSATTVLVFGVLACSTIPVLHAIGLTAACGSFVCLLFAAAVAESPLEPHVA